MKDMPVPYHRILNRLEARERRLLNRRTFSPLAPQMEKLRARIPNALRAKLEFAFEKAFSLLFGPEGTRFLEHTYAKKKLETQARIWDTPLPPVKARKALSELERSAGLNGSVSTVAAGAEGAVLGLLGVGLPDIPVLLSWLLRVLYQSATRYGFSYDSEGERVYLLLLLQGALSEGERRRELSLRADKLGRAMDHGWNTTFCLEDEIRKTAVLLSERLLLVKFIQGLPLVGVVGGLSNLPLSRGVEEYGRIKYKKRFLERKVRGL